jgi:hypothetical protein
LPALLAILDVGKNEVRDLPEEYQHLQNDDGNM